MMSKEEREYRERQQFAKRFMETYNQLSPWHKFEVRLYISWLLLRHRIKTLPVRWVELQLKLEQDIKIHGMPFKIKWQLMKWFNYRPDPNDKFLLWKGKKIWYHFFLEEDNFELHLNYKNKHPGFVWLQLKNEGEGTIIGIHIGEDFRYSGLGTWALQESIPMIKNRVSCIKGVLEREGCSNFEKLLNWYSRQGFEITHLPNGDCKVELKIT